MMELWVFLVMMMLMFGTIGYMRGYTKELVATSGIVLALFTLKQFETLITDPLTSGAPHSKFWFQAIILGLFAFFSYQTPVKTFASLPDRKGVQDGVLGGLVGSFNGYLLFGSLWWYMDQLGYPFSPNVIDPVGPTTTSADVAEILPLEWMLSGDGSVLSLLMIGFFVFIIVVVV
ncbi:MAG: CvpA family protein [Anaerolineae bacterium]|nr:CvpA family protein [Anaerolineae bacterium]